MQVSACVLRSNSPSIGLLIPSHLNDAYMWLRINHPQLEDKEEGDDDYPSNVADDNNHPFFVLLAGMWFHANSFMKLNLSHLFAPLEG
ncbi:PREDICTED: DEAD-box ATP-dependent RNA helicase 28, partial [Prunus dulcis]